MDGFTTVYGVTNEDGADNGTNEEYYPTLAEARRRAVQIAEEQGECTISRYRVMSLSRRDLVCTLLNHDGWFVSREEVAVVRGRDRERDGPWH